jgi:hypothetical protein
MLFCSDDVTGKFNLLTDFLYLLLKYRYPFACCGSINTLLVLLWLKLMFFNKKKRISVGKRFAKIPKIFDNIHRPHKKLQGHLITRDLQNWCPGSRVIDD